MATSKNNKKAVEATSISEAPKSPEPAKSTQAAPPEKQSQLATILIGLLIVASGLLIYNYFQASSSPQTTTITDSNQQSNNADSKENDQPDAADEQAEGSYTVAAGDTLWSIAEQVYGDGFRWPEIAQANQLARDNSGRPLVETGQRLTIPDSAASTVAEKPTATPGSEDLQQPNAKLSSYTVVSGDTLWSIAEQVYGDGFQWVKIFNDQSNRLSKLPNGRPLIHAGNVLHIPQ